MFVSKRISLKSERHSLVIGARTSSTDRSGDRQRGIRVTESLLLVGQLRLNAVTEQNRRGAAVIVGRYSTQVAGSVLYSINRCMSWRR